MGNFDINKAGRHGIRKHRLSRVVALPYHPNLKCESLRQTTAIVIFTYLEIYWPAEPLPEDSKSLASEPVEVDIEELCADLRISRLTFRYFWRRCATVWRDELARARARQAGREFLERPHGVPGPMKPYSAVMPWPLPIDCRTLILRRNRKLIASILYRAGLETLAPVVPSVAVPGLPTTAPLQSDSLIDILLRGSDVAQDRRQQRYPRLKRAIEAGIETTAAIRIKKKKKKKPKPTQAVDPSLPPAMVARLSAKKGHPQDHE
jgi:hypothetical protein